MKIKFKFQLSEMHGAERVKHLEIVPNFHPKFSFKFTKRNTPPWVSSSIMFMTNRIFNLNFCNKSANVSSISIGYENYNEVLHFLSKCSTYKCWAILKTSRTESV